MRNAPASADLDNTVSLDLGPDPSPGADDVVVAIEAAPNFRRRP